MGKRTPAGPARTANRPPLEPLNVTLIRFGRGITSVRFGMDGDAQENFTAFARGNLADLAQRSIGNAEHIAAAFLNANFAEHALRLTTTAIQKHRLAQNERANAAGVAVLAATFAVHGALLAHVRENGWMQFNALSLCRSSIEGAAKACVIALGTSNEIELWENGLLHARPAATRLSAELRKLEPKAEDAEVVYKWLCGFTHAQGSVLAKGPPSAEAAHAAFAFVSWACAAVSEMVIGINGHAKYPTVLPAKLPWNP